MLKGLLTGIMRRISAPPPGDAALVPSLPPVGDEDLRALEDKWRQAPFIEAADFTAAYRAAHRAHPDPRQGEGPMYSYSSKCFLLTAGLQQRMIHGVIPFLYPRPGTCSFPGNNRDMFFAEHCYIPITKLFQWAREIRDGGGSRHDAALFIMALRNAAETALPLRLEDIDRRLYGFESGRGASKRYFLSAYEAGASFYPVLRHKDGGYRAALLESDADAPRLPQL